MPDVQHSIKVAAQRSGLSAHLIRVWERRYGAVEPRRTGTNRRLYSDADVERLRLLREATLAGHTIGNIAGLPAHKLRGLLASTGTVSLNSPLRTATSPEQRFLSEAIAAVKDLDSELLKEVMTRAHVALGQQGLLAKFVVPLAQEIGRRWRDGDLTAAHEHFASALVRLFLGNSMRPFAKEEAAPGIVVATPSGQLHELGAVIAAAAAASAGWRVTYLGAALPAAEIAGAALQNRVRAVALSIIYPEDDPVLASELVALRCYLGAEIEIIVGGRAANAYQASLRQIGAIRLDDLERLYPELDKMRRQPA